MFYRTPLAIRFTKPPIPTMRFFDLLLSARHGRYFFGVLCLSVPAVQALPADSSESGVESGPLVVLTDGMIEVGVLPEVGGRIVLLRREGGPNLLQSNPDYWDEPEAERPDPQARPRWKDYGGHITWLAPQSEWWNRQELYPRMRDRPWPPDPYLIYAPYEIVEQSRMHLILQGPASPISGVSLRKEVRLPGGGRVAVRATAVNTTDAPLSWSLWSNTRFAGRVPAYLPLVPGREPGYAFLSPFRDEEKAAMPYRVVDGYFTFSSDLPVPEGMKNWNNKVSAVPRDGVLAAFPEGSAFIKRTGVGEARASGDSEGVGDESAGRIIGRSSRPDRRR